MPKRRPRKPNATGRTEDPLRFVQLDYWILETEAARNLSGTGFKVLIYVLKRFNGRNNGKIAFGVRSGSYGRLPGKPALIEMDIGLSKSRVAEALHELEMAGFLHCTQESSFDQKKLVKEWRLTWLPCGGVPATKDFVKLQRSNEIQNPVLPSGLTGKS